MVTFEGLPGYNNTVFGLVSYCWWFRNPKQPLFGCIKPVANTGINYQTPSTGEFTGFLNHQQFGDPCLFAQYFSRCFNFCTSSMEMIRFDNFAFNWGCSTTNYIKRQWGRHVSCSLVNNFQQLTMMMIIMDHDDDDDDDDHGDDDDDDDDDDEDADEYGVTLAVSLVSVTNFNPFFLTTTTATSTTATTTTTTTRHQLMFFYSQVVPLMGSSHWTWRWKHWTVPEFFGGMDLGTILPERRWLWI